jgi:hypothetical protein
MTVWPGGQARPWASIVQIAPTDAGFSSSRCGTWTRIG